MEEIIYNIESGGRRFSLNKNLTMAKYGWASSSVSPEKLSLSIKSFVVFLPALVVLLNAFGAPTTIEELEAVLNSLLGVVTASAVFASSLTGLYGLIRKIVARAGLI